jgi:hypothetical protein
MKTTLITTIALLALTSIPLAARSPSAVEDTQEISPQLLTLPPMVGETLAYQKCSACKRFSHTLASSARFYIKNQEVSYEALKRHIDSHPQAVVLVVTSIKDNVVTRLTAQ